MENIIVMGSIDAMIGTIFFGRNKVEGKEQKSLSRRYDSAIGEDK